MADTLHDSIRLPDPAKKMNFDGERYVSGLSGEIAHEHYLRYLFAMQFCVGKDVLDIASGEGYGSRLLSEVASTVCGVDLSADAVAFAREQYGSATISFIEGDVRDIPHPPASFDVVVSFETIEHISEHEQFLAEIKRVLRPQGLLIISSPNRDVYLKDLPANPFHRREPNRAEFAALLDQHFRHRILGLQRSMAGAVLLPEAVSDSRSFTTYTVDRSLVTQAAGLGPSTYLVAVGTDGTLPEFSWGLLIDKNFAADLRASMEGTVRRLVSDIQNLNDERATFVAEVQRLDRERATVTAANEQLALQLEEQRARCAKLNDERGTFVSEVQRLDRERAAVTAANEQLALQLEEQRARCANLHVQCQESLKLQRTRLLSDVLQMLS